MRISKLIVSICLCFLIAFLGSLVTFSSISTWYAGLNKPFFNPPNFIFGPVWSILYTLMGIALFLVWEKGLKNKNVSKAVKIFLLQLALNFLWSLVFFGFHLPFAALIVILALWISIFYAILLFKKISKPAYLLLTPYIAWVSFALILNFFIAILN